MIKTGRSSPLPEQARRPAHVQADRCIPLASRAIDSCWVICEAIHCSLPGHWLNYVNGANDIDWPRIELLAPVSCQTYVRALYKTVRYHNKLQLVPEIKTLRSDRKCAWEQRIYVYTSSWWHFNEQLVALTEPTTGPTAAPSDKWREQCVETKGVPQPGRTSTVNIFWNKRPILMKFGAGRFVYCWQFLYGYSDVFCARHLKSVIFKSKFSCSMQGEEKSRFRFTRQLMHINTYVVVYKQTYV
jgi:hypothetical protein